MPANSDCDLRASGHGPITKRHLVLPAAIAIKGAGLPKAF
jgi:hypothetical protein